MGGGLGVGPAATTKRGVMIIRCNRPGGVGLRGLRLVKGENIVDDAVWNAVKARHKNGIIEAMTKPVNGVYAFLEIVGDKPKGPGSEQWAEPGHQTEPEAEPESIPVREKLVLVRAATSARQLDALEQGETRKTVLTAIYKKAVQLDNQQAGG